VDRISEEDGRYRIPKIKRNYKSQGRRYVGGL